MGVTAHGGWVSQRQEPSESCFSIETPVLLNLQTRGSEMDDNPILQVLGSGPLGVPLAAWSLPFLHTGSSFLLLWAQRVLVTNCKGDIVTPEGKWS